MDARAAAEALTLPDLQALLDAAGDFAREAGRLVGADFRRADSETTSKGGVDLVTDTDHRSEALLVDRIGRAFPGHGILAEETGRRPGDTRYRWLIDPLDGTSNFVRRIPHVSILLAVQQREGDHWRTVVGVVLDPLRDELFAAARGGGATLNGEPIAVSTTPRVAEGLFATGFASDRRSRPIEAGNHREYARINWISHGVRRFASAGLDLAYVAAGRLEGFWEAHLGPWDLAAGGLLVEEAGGAFTTDRGVDVVYADEWQSPLAVASNGRLHAELLRELQGARDAAV